MNVKHRVSILGLAVAMLFGGNAIAGEASKQIEGAIGAKIIKTAPSAMPGYTAILAVKDGKKRIFYETADGQHLIYGMVYDAKGVNLTTLDAAMLTGNAQPGEQSSGVQQPVTAAPRSSQKQIDTTADNDDHGDEFIVSNKLLDQASKTFYMKEGKGNVVYVVFDPDCPFCKELYQNTRSSLGTAEIRWIPVGALSLPGGSSQRKTAELMRVKNMNSIHTLQGVTPTEKENAMMQNNLEMLAALEANQVPLVLWQDKDKVHLIKGLPKTNRMQSIFGRKG